MRRPRTGDSPGITGVARVDRRTRILTDRLQAGEIAVIDHLDLDRVAAESLVGARVAAVVNAAPSVSGRYPNLGPEIIAAAGIPLVDVVDGDLFALVRDGDRVRLDGGQLFRGDRLVAEGELLDPPKVAERLAAARSGLAAQLEAFTFNSVEYLRRDQAVLLDGVGVPDLRTRLAGRPVVLVVRSYDYRADLRGLKSYLRENRPVLVGVGRGADALVEAGYVPDLIVGDLGAVSDRTLRSGAELVTAGPSGDDERLDRLGLEAHDFPATGTDEDAAMLLADSCGADLIVSVGSHASLEESLDRGQAGLASAFVTRLRVGPKLVDAKSVARLHHNRVRTWQLVLLVLAAVLAVLLAVAVTPAGQQWLNVLGDGWSDLLSGVRERFR